MIELKIQCDCGQRYKFDVEPVNGRMPFTVACPVCGLDGTERANALLEQTQAYEAAQSPPLPPTILPVPVPGQLKLRLSTARYMASESAPPPVASASNTPAPIRTSPAEN